MICNFCRFAGGIEVRPRRSLPGPSRPPLSGQPAAKKESRPRKMHAISQIALREEYMHAIGDVTFSGARGAIRRCPPSTGLHFLSRLLLLRRASDSDSGPAAPPDLFHASYLIFTSVSPPIIIKNSSSMPPNEVTNIYNWFYSSSLTNNLYKHLTTLD